LPDAALINVNGTLYGTTFLGGTYCSGDAGCGTVFKITTSGAESVVYSFEGGSAGYDPQARLLNVKGTLYGTTLDTVFKVTPSGTETVLQVVDGYPFAGLTDVGGTLYGTTAWNSGETGNGTVFSLRP